MDLKTVQQPIKQQYRNDPSGAKITLRAKGNMDDTPIACSVDIGRAVYAAQAHSGVGGEGTAACSGDLLLGALAACAQVTSQMVAAAMGLEVDVISAEVEGDLDLRGTLGVSRDVPVGFEEIRLRFVVDAPKLDDDQVEELIEKSERYCVVMQTLTTPPSLNSSWTRSA